MSESLRARWVRRDEPLRLSLAQLTLLTEPAFPGQHVVDAALTAGGQANTNWRLVLSDHPAPVLLRICTRQAEGEVDVPASVSKEAALHRRLSPDLPVPAVYFAATTNPVTGHAYLLREWANGERLEVAAHRLDAPVLTDLATDIGRVLAGIHAVRFPSAGFLDDMLRVVRFPPEVESGMLPFVQTLLGEHGAERLGPELTDALLAFARRENFYGATWRSEPHLVHSDFGGSNIVVAPGAGPRSDAGEVSRAADARVRVAAVVDWEFAFSSSSPFGDLGNLLRPPLGDMPGFADAVAGGYRAAGGALPADWRRRTLYEDLLAWASFLGRPRVGEAIVEDARRMIARTLALLEGQVG